MDQRVSVTACRSYQRQEVEAALDALLSPIDGLGWVRPGMKIAVKANLVTALGPEKAATPHPELALALCRRLTERGAKVVLGDSPGGFFTKAALDNVYRATGMELVCQCGAALNQDFTEKEISLPETKALKSFWATGYLLEADAIIDLCKLKTHALMGYTGACKNMFGSMAGLHKSECHYRFPTHAQFAAMLVDLCEYWKPTLSVCDGVVAMEGNGPSYGDPRPMGVLLASFNPHALDLAASHLIGLGCRDVPTLYEACSRGLCPETVEALELFGDPEPFRVTDFKLQPKEDMRFWGVHNNAFYNLMRPFVVSRPVPDGGCIGCGKCASLCPAKAITMKNRKPHIDRKKCITCFCCGEFCPKGAMKAREPLVVRLTQKHREG